jgi:hypothetical protein
VTSVKLLSPKVRLDPVENGCTFTATAAMSVTHLCRYPVPGARNIQTVSIYTVAGLRVASVDVDALNATTKDALGFVCSAVESAVALTQGGK